MCNLKFAGFSDISTNLCKCELSSTRSLFATTSSEVIHAITQALVSKSTVIKAIFRGKRGRDERAEEEEDFEFVVSTYTGR